MNIEALRNTRRLMAHNPESYAQHRWMHGPHCRTPACVAGFAALANGARDFREVPGAGYVTCREPGFDRSTTVYHYAMTALELTETEAAQMFAEIPVSDDGELVEQPTAHQAFAMLDHAIEHNEVLWAGWRSQCC